MKLGGSLRRNRVVPYDEILQRSLDVPVVATPAGPGGVYYRVPDFRKNVLHRLFRLPGAGSLWTLREVPFEIVQKAAGGEDPLAAPSTSGKNVTAND